MAVAGVVELGKPCLGQLLCTPYCPCAGRDAGPASGYGGGGRTLIRPSPLQLFPYRVLGQCYKCNDPTNT